MHDLRGFPGPRLLIGDLNMTPAETPNRQLDHILTDDDRLRSGATEAELMPISDHRPLVADLDRE
jgi:endonuclease/exonuclease/phosphatase family metal-dependent hydrolase